MLASLKNTSNTFFFETNATSSLKPLHLLNLKSMFIIPKIKFCHLQVTASIPFNLYAQHHLENMDFKLMEKCSVLASSEA